MGFHHRRYLTDFFEKLIDNGDPRDIINLDLKKAFDKVPCGDRVRDETRYGWKAGYKNYRKQSSG